MHLIQSKFSTKRDGHTTININGEYHCLVEIEDDLVNSTEEIFAPFINAGFKVINLSDKIDEIQGENVYLISWKQIFINKDGKNNK